MGKGMADRETTISQDWIGILKREECIHCLRHRLRQSSPPKSSLNIFLLILPPEGMIQFRLRLFHFAILLISFLFYTKVRRVANIQAFLAEQSNSNSFINSNQQYGQQFKEAFEKIQNGPPAILLLNKFALNISLNFVCNLRKFPGAAGRLVAVVFDTFSLDLLKKSFPEIGVIHWQFPILEEKFGAGDGRYQLFQYFRAKLASLLTEIVPAFWMVQADTIWRQDLFNIINLDGGEFANADLVFDSEGDEGLLKSMIAGGYFFVRSSNRTKQFFDSIAQFLLDHFATDNNVMARQCILGLFDVKCAQIPYKIISNWRKGPNNGPAALFQFDGGDGAADKFDKMRAQGHLFVEPKTIPALKIMENIEVVKCLETSIGGNGGEIEGKNSSGKKNYLMTFVQSAIEFLMANLKSEAFKHFILTHLFPYYAAYLFN